MKWIQDMLEAVPADFPRKPLEPTAPGNRVLGPLDGDAERVFWAVEYALSQLNGDADAHKKLHDDPAHGPEDCIAFHAMLKPRVSRVQLLERVLMEELTARYGSQLKTEERFAVTADGVVAVSEVPDFIRELAEALGTSPKVDRAPGMLAITLEGSVPDDASPEKGEGILSRLFGR